MDHKNLPNYFVEFRSFPADSKWVEKKASEFSTNWPPKGVKSLKLYEKFFFRIHFDSLLQKESMHLI